MVSIRAVRYDPVMGLRRRRRVTPVLPVALLGLGLVVFAACQDPTQLTLAISTNAKCHDELKATAIYVGGSLGGVNEKVQTSSPVAQTATCTSGDIGTLVVTPGNSQGAVVVIGGFYGKPPTDCVEGHYENCIIARRSFTFIKHASLVIPIPLERSCLNVPCSATTTCHNGACYDAAVDCSSNVTCAVPGTEPDAGSVDAGPNAFVDAPSDMDATSSGSEAGGSGADSSADAADAADSAITKGGTPVCKLVQAQLVVSNCSATDCATLEACCTPNGGGALTCSLAGGNCDTALPILCCDHSDCPMGKCCVGGNTKPVSGVPILDPMPPDGAVVCGFVNRADNTTPGTCQ